MNGIRSVTGACRRPSIAVALLAAIGLSGAACGSASAETVSQTFTAGGETAWIVPPTVTAVKIDAVGAAGDSQVLGGDGGAGAEVYGAVPVTPGQTLYLDVDQGGGPGGYATPQPAYGGGYSGVRECAPSTSPCSSSSASPLLIAAGGGAGGGDYESGAGGPNGGAAGTLGVFFGAPIDAPGSAGGTEEGSGGAGGGGSLAGPCQGGAGVYGGSGGSVGGPLQGGAGGYSGLNFTNVGGGGGGGGYAGGCGGGGAGGPFGDEEGGAGGGGASFVNNPEVLDDDANLPEVVDFGSTQAQSNAPQLSLTFSDTHTPSLSLAAPTEGARDGAQPQFSGVAGDAGDDAPSVTITISQGASVVETFTAPVGAGGDFDSTVPTPLPSGAYLATVTQTLVDGSDPATDTVAFFSSGSVSSTTSTTSSVLTTTMSPQTTSSSSSSTVTSTLPPTTISSSTTSTTSTASHTTSSSSTTSTTSTASHTSTPTTSTTATSSATTTPVAATTTTSTSTRTTSSPAPTSSATTTTMSKATTTTTSETTSATTTTSRQAVTAPRPSLVLVGAPNGSDGRVRVTLRCKGSGGSCPLRLALTTLEHLARGRIAAVTASTRSVRVGAASRTLTAGRQVTVTIDLNASGRDLLARLGRLPVELSVSLRSELALTHRVTVTPSHRAVR